MRFVVEVEVDPHGVDDWDHVAVALLAHLEAMEFPVPDVASATITEAGLIVDFPP